MIFSFLGWFLDCCFAAAKKKKFVNRGLLGGPFSCLYGIHIVLGEIFLSELRNHLFFLMSGCVVLFGVCEWVSGKLLQRIYGKRFWDYSDSSFHIDGYVCISSMLRGGLFGMAGICWINPVISRMVHYLPAGIIVALQVVLLGMIAADTLWTHAFLLGVSGKRSSLKKIHNSMVRSSSRIQEWIIRHSYSRIRRAFPFMKREVEEKKDTVFAYGCGFYKLFWLFLIGSLAGDLIETVFCRITEGAWMSRSSLVIGPFSVVWGLGIALFTWFLFNYRHRSDSFIFLMGTILGGLFEYICSIFTEIVFGRVFWDYSDIPFNLGGRINLLFCFFWGIAAVVWMKWGYPFFSGYIEKLPVRAGKYITWLLCLCTAMDILLSVTALVRYDERAGAKPPQNGVERWMDVHYPDPVMERIYPNAKTEMGE